MSRPLTGLPTCLCGNPYSEADSECRYCGRAIMLNGKPEPNAPAPVSARVPLSEAAVPREEPRAEPIDRTIAEWKQWAESDVKLTRDPSERAVHERVIKLCTALASARAALDANEEKRSQAEESASFWRAECHEANLRNAELQAALDEAKRREEYFRLELERWEIWMEWDKMPDATRPNWYDYYRERRAARSSSPVPEQTPATEPT